MVHRHLLARPIFEGRTDDEGLTTGMTIASSAFGDPSGCC